MFFYISLEITVVCYPQLVLQRERQYPVIAEILGRERALECK